jgi:uncharacterized membrane protein YjdF
MDDCGVDHFKPGKLRLAVANWLLRRAHQILPGFTVLIMAPCVVAAYQARILDLQQRALLASLPEDGPAN